MSDSMSSFNNNNNFITKTTMTFTTNLQDIEHQTNNNQQHHHSYHHYYQQQQYEQKQKQQQPRQKIMTLNDYSFFETTNTNTTMNANECCNLNPLRIFPTTGSSSNPNNTCTTHTTTAKPSPIIVYQTNLNNNNDCHNHNNHNSHHHNHHNHLAYTNDESFALRSALKRHFLQKQKQKNLSTPQQEDFYNTNRKNNWNENNDNIEEIHHQDSQRTKMYNFSFHPVSTTTTTTTNIDASNNTNSLGKPFTDTNNIYQSRNTFHGNLNQVLTDALDLICDTDDGVENNNNNNNVSLDNDGNDDNISMISEMTISTEHTNCMMEPNHAVIVPAEKYKIKIPVVSTSNLTTTVDASTPNSQDIAVLTNNKEDGDDQDDDFTVNTALFDDDLPTIAYNNNVHQPHSTSNNTDLNNNKPPLASTKSSTKSSILSNTGIIRKRLKEYMECSRITQEMLQDWDEKNGLPRSHSVTMFRTNRSRTQLLENRILPKWNGKPLIGNEPIQKKIIKDKKKNSSNNKIKKKKHSLQQSTMKNLKKLNKQTK